jgi:glycosyltransferase involved in cell wall biosynthesis
MYHGLIKNSRGIETLIDVVSMNPNIVAVILAVVRDDDYFSKIKRLVDEYAVADRILFLPAVPIDRLWEFVGAADVGVSILKNTCINHYFCLNNKFFESIQSLTPVIVSDFPELSRIVNHYDIGLTCDPASVDEINACIERMRTDKELYAKFKKNLLVAKEELCWEREKEGLVMAYRDLYDEVLRERQEIADRARNDGM